MTNYEKIKAMSIEEMAKDIEKTISYNLCCYCVQSGSLCNSECSKRTDYEVIMEWLESEVKQDG